MGLRTIVSRICLVALFFFNGISGLSNLPLARSSFEASAKVFHQNYREASGSEFLLTEALLLENAYLIVTLWGCLAVVCSIAAVLKVKWGAWMLVAMLLMETVPAWYEKAPHSVALVLSNLALVGGLLVMTSVIATKQPEKSRTSPATHK